MKPNKTFHFSLVLKNVDANTKNLEDILYEAGCDDALINYRNNTVYLDFDRESTSLEEAVISAIKSIQSINIQISSVSPENLVTESEIAKRLEMPRQTISLWIKGERRASFPHPIMHVNERSPLWSWVEVTTWLFENKIITSNKTSEDALFFANINAALEENKENVTRLRHRLSEKTMSTRARY